MRPEGKKTATINAGLLKYAAIIIDNEVVNDFKRMGRVDDLSNVILNDGMSPELSNNETIAYEVDENEEKKAVLCDTRAGETFEESERRSDITALINGSNLTDEEYEVILRIDLQNMSVRAFSDEYGIQIQKIHRIRNSALRKMRGSKLDKEGIKDLVKSVCLHHNMTIEQVLAPEPYGPSVVARTDLFTTLYDHGMNVEAISSYFLYPQPKIVAAINRRCIQDMRVRKPKN
jgi:hypothetical protein